MEIDDNNEDSHADSETLESAVLSAASEDPESDNQVLDPDYVDPNDPNSDQEEDGVRRSNRNSRTAKNRRFTLLYLKTFKLIQIVRTTIVRQDYRHRREPLRKGEWVHVTWTDRDGNRHNNIKALIYATANSLGYLGLLKGKIDYNKDLEDITAIWRVPKKAMVVSKAKPGNRGRGRGIGRMRGGRLTSMPRQSKGQTEPAGECVPEDLNSAVPEGLSDGPLSRVVIPSATTKVGGDNDEGDIGNDIDEENGQNVVADQDKRRLLGYGPAEGKDHDFPARLPIYAPVAKAKTQKKYQMVVAHNTRDLLVPNKKIYQRMTEEQRPTKTVAYTKLESTQDAVIGAMFVGNPRSLVINKDTGCVNTELDNERSRSEKRKLAAAYNEEFEHVKYNAHLEMKCNKAKRQAEEKKVVAEFDYHSEELVKQVRAMGRLQASKATEGSQWVAETIIYDIGADISKVPQRLHDLLEDFYAQHKKIPELRQEFHAYKLTEDIKCAIEKDCGTWTQIAASIKKDSERVYEFEPIEPNIPKDLQMARRIASIIDEKVKRELQRCGLVEMDPNMLDLAEHGELEDQILNLVHSDPHGLLETSNEKSVPVVGENQNKDPTVDTTTQLPGSETTGDVYSHEVHVMTDDGEDCADENQYELDPSDKEAIRKGEDKHISECVKRFCSKEKFGKSFAEPEAAASNVEDYRRIGGILALTDEEEELAFSNHSSSDWGDDDCTILDTPSPKPYKPIKRMKLKHSPDRFLDSESLESHLVEKVNSSTDSNLDSPDGPHDYVGDFIRKNNIKIPGFNAPLETNDDEMGDQSTTVNRNIDTDVKKVVVKVEPKEEKLKATGQEEDYIDLTGLDSPLSPETNVIEDQLKDLLGGVAPDPELTTLLNQAKTLKNGADLVEIAMYESGFKNLSQVDGADDSDEEGYHAEKHSAAVDKGPIDKPDSTEGLSSGIGNLIQPRLDGEQLNTAQLVTKGPDVRSDTNMIESNCVESGDINGSPEASDGSASDGNDIGSTSVSVISNYSPVGVFPPTTPEPEFASPSKVQTPGAIGNILPSTPPTGMLTPTKVSLTINPRRSRGRARSLDYNMVVQQDFLQTSPIMPTQAMSPIIHSPTMSPLINSPTMSPSRQVPGHYMIVHSPQGPMLQQIHVYSPDHQVNVDGSPFSPQSLVLSSQLQPISQEPSIPNRPQSQPDFKRPHHPQSPATMQPEPVRQPSAPVSMAGDPSHASTAIRDKANVEGLKGVLRNLIGANKKREENEDKKPTLAELENARKNGRKLQEFETTVRNFIRRTDSLEEDLCKKITTIAVAGKTATILLRELRKKETEIRQYMNSLTDERERSGFHTLLQRNGALWNQLTPLVEQYEALENQGHTLSNEQYNFLVHELKTQESKAKHNHGMAVSYDKTLQFSKMQSDSRMESLTILRSSVDAVEKSVRDLSVNLIKDEEIRILNYCLQLSEETKRIINNILEAWKNSDKKIAENRAASYQQELNDLRKETEIIRQTMTKLINRKDKFKDFTTAQIDRGMRTIKSQLSKADKRWRDLEDRAQTVKELGQASELVRYGEEIWHLSYCWEHKKGSNPSTPTKRKNCGTSPGGAKKFAVENCVEGFELDTDDVEQYQDNTYWDNLVKKEKKKQPMIRRTADPQFSSQNVVKMLRRNEQMIFGIPRGAVIEIMSGCPTENILMVRMNTLFKIEAFENGHEYNLEGTNGLKCLYERGERDPRITFCYEAAVLRFPLSEDSYPFKLRKAFLREALNARFRNLRQRKMNGEGGESDGNEDSHLDPLENVMDPRVGVSRSEKRMTIGQIKGVLIKHKKLAAAKKK